MGCLWNKSIMKRIKRIITCAILLAGPAQAASVDFPGTPPGKPNLSVSQQGEITLENNVLGVSWKLTGGSLALTEIENRATGRKFPQNDAAAFRIKVSGSREYVADWQVLVPPKAAKAEVDKRSPSNGRHYPGESVTVVFKSPGSGIVLRWTAEMRSGAGYLQTRIKLGSADGSEKHLGEIKLIDNLVLPSPQVARTGNGSPIYDKDARIFCGMEVPFFHPSTRNGARPACSAGFSCGNLKVGGGITPEFSAVMAVFPEGQLRRSVLHYIDRARARSYKQFLHYNCWFDLERKVSEKGMLDRMDAIYEELGKKRGVYLDAYVVDDGYDDPGKGFWVFDEKKFPNGFAGLSAKLAEIHSHLGVWLSPACGYGQAAKDRARRAAEMGIKTFDLSSPVYNKWFLDKMTRFVKDDKVVYFKWDKLGGGVSNHFMALMEIARKLRELNPSLFLNTTCGTWQSPFWLHDVDCTWRAGNDMGFQGDGDTREQWLTYRDGMSYSVIKKSDFIYPLNALMNHGIVFANGHMFANKALKGTHDMRNDVRMYFAGGYALQELYITPGIMKDAQWDAIAEGAKWAKKHADVLVDSHFVGGDPLRLEVYGFAAWQNDKGTLALRNPKSEPQSFVFDIGKIFELPRGAGTCYKLDSPFADQRLRTLGAEAGKEVTVELKPFEVLLFDAEQRQSTDSATDESKQQTKKRK
jgi:hypothetical protein